MEAAFAIAGYGPDRIQESFPALWNAFHYGPPPHAGIAPGFDRILMLLEDQANLREVIAFPLNQAARDLLMGAPSAVCPAQLAELHLRVVPPGGRARGSAGRAAWRRAPVGSSGTSSLMDGRTVPFLRPLRPII